MINKESRFAAIHKLLSIMVSIMLILTMSGCSMPIQETEEPEVIEEDISVYGDESLGIDAAVDEALRDYRTILLAGIDDGNRADILIVLCLNENTEEIKVFTVSREVYMQIADGKKVELYDYEWDFQRCNESYNVGGKYELMKELNRHLDLNIKEFIGADWACTAKFVDAVGGIECDIESQSMLDAINFLIRHWPDGDQELIESTGKQTLKGWQAVHYLRVRMYDGGSPLVRDDRNREVAEALLNKAKSMSVEEIVAVYDEIADDLDTNMSRNKLTDTFGLIATSEVTDAGSWPYEYERKWEPEQKVIYTVAHSLYSNVVQLHANVFDQTEYLPSNTVQELSDEIADRVQNYLKDDPPKQQ